MASISGSTKEVIYTVQKFLGLHESPDGDTKLKAGEAAIMRSFRVTRAGNLQRRPGYFRKFNGNIKALWSGFVGPEQSKTEYLIVATDTELYWTTDTETWTKIGNFTFNGYGVKSGVKVRLYFYGLKFISIFVLAGKRNVSNS